MRRYDLVRYEDDSLSITKLVGTGYIYPSTPKVGKNFACGSFVTSHVRSWDSRRKLLKTATDTFTLLERSSTSNERVDAVPVDSIEKVVEQSVGKGEKGEKGDTGATGSTGATGEAGTGSGVGATNIVTDYRSIFESSDGKVYDGYMLNGVITIIRTLDGNKESAINLVDLEADWINRLILTYV